ncbi:class I SAM-dependent methyltransferase [Streptomyces longwoodensis]|uniref:class I SAM-dependent methyltransferase n=1 Tax=Streptomyces longwoodensis TaxID=68231 RepID=UPI0033D26530
MDWHTWHRAYDAPDSYLSRRLALVRERIADALDGAPDGPLRAVSVCAGQGRDLIGVLAGHPRRDDVRARLVELDERNVAHARRAAAEAGLHRVEVVAGDASATDAYAGMAPADLVLLCGVLGNLTDADVRRTLDHCTRLCRPGGVLVWTRTRHHDTGVCGWLEERGFVPLWVSGPEVPYGVGAHRYAGRGGPWPAGRRMFSFVGYGALHGRQGPPAEPSSASP